jgi:hypothetical protein
MISVEGLEIRRLRGSGGFADVYEAFEPALDRRVALKVFRARVDRNERRSFEREATAMGRLSGRRNIVDVYQANVSEDGRPYLVMELMAGSVEDLLRAGPLSPEVTAGVGALIGDALAAAHAEGVLHRDIKPANLLVDRYGEPALSDFGIASLVGAATASSISAFSAEHAAPEVFEQPTATPAADVYSLGSTLFTMLEGHAPFPRREDEGPLAYMHRVQSAPAPSAEAAPAAVDELLQRMLDKQPERRPELDEVVATLRGLAGSTMADGVQLPVDELAVVGTPITGAMLGDPTEDPDPPAVVPLEPGSGTDTAARRRGPEWVLMVVAVLVAIGVIAAFALGGGDDANVVEGSTSTESTSTQAAPNHTDDRLDGVNRAEPANDPSLTDTSGVLRARLDTHADESEFPAFDGQIRTNQDASYFRFGELPARVDMAASNAYDTTKCRRVLLDGIVVTGAASSIWSDGRHVVVASVAQLADEQEARQYYWATTLYMGLNDDQCDGWPEDQVAQNPDELTVDRQEYEVDAPVDDYVSSIDDHPDFGDVQGGIAYQSIARQGDLVIVVGVGTTSDDVSISPSAAMAEVDRVLSTVAGA